MVKIRPHTPRKVHVHKPYLHVDPSWFPILSSVFGVAAFIAGYVIAVLNDHEEAWFSLISDGGALPPESCIFGLLLNFSAFFWLLTCFARHLQLIQYVHFYRGPQTKFRVITYFMLFIGIISGIGMAGVANFQEGTVPIAHSISALLTFFGSVVYAWCYVLVSLIIKPKFAPRSLNAFRVLLVLVVTGAFVFHQLTGTIRPFVKNLPDGSKPPAPERPSNGIYRYKPDDPDYLNHLIGCITEWILACGSYVITASLWYELTTFEINTLSKDEQQELWEEKSKPELIAAKYNINDKVESSS